MTTTDKFTAIQGIIAVLLLCGTFALLILKIDVPSVVYGFDGAALGLFIGTRTGALTIMVDRSKPPTP